MTITEIEKRITASRKGSSMRNYLAVAQRLRAVFGENLPLPETISPALIDKFTSSLLKAGLTPASTALYRRLFRAILVKTYGKENRALILEAFGKETEPSGETVKIARGFTASHIRTLLAAPLTDYPYFRKIRDLFIFSLLGAGKEIQTTEYTPSRLIPQQEELIRKFHIRHGVELNDFANTTTPDKYERALAAIGHLLRFPRSLTPRSAAESWISLASEAGIEPSIIASIVGKDNEYTRLLDSPVTLSEEERELALVKVADTVYPLSLRWFVMRCFRQSVAEMKKILEGITEEMEGDFLDTFSLQQSDSAGGALLPLLFFRSTAENAERIKKLTSTDAHVYSYRDSRRPAYIPDADMKTFLFLADVAGETIAFHFPEDKADPLHSFLPKENVVINKGDFSGLVGIVGKASKDRLKVAVRIEAANGMTITADIPREFLSRQKHAEATPQLAAEIKNQ